MDLNDHRRAIWRKRWRVLLLSLAVAAAIYARSASLEEVFSAEAQLQVEPAGSGSDVRSDEALFLATTYAELISSDAVVRDAIVRSGLRLSRAEAGDRLTADASDTAGFLSVTATGPTPEAARALAQGGADALTASVADASQAKRDALIDPIDLQLSALLDALRATEPGSVERDVLQAQYQTGVNRRSDVEAAGMDSVQVVTPATAESAPVAPTPTRDALLAFVIALIVNAELVVALEALSGRLSGNDDEVVRVTGLPVLTRIPVGSEREAVEALRVLRTSLLFLESSGDVRCLAVVGVDQGVGATFVATRLAAVTSSLELPVVLIDGDLRSPGVGRVFGVPDQPGLGDLTADDDPATRLVPVADHPYLRIIPAGRSSDDPAGLLSGRFRSILARLPDADLIVVDTPPAGAFAETAAIAAQCDLCVVVIDRGTTRRKNVVEVVESLRRVGANPVGVVLNREADAPTPSRSRRLRR